MITVCYFKAVGINYQIPSCITDTGISNIMLNAFIDVCYLWWGGRKIDQGTVYAWTWVIVSAKYPNIVSFIVFG